MLIRFTVENFLNFRNETELAMFPGQGQQPPLHVLPAKDKDDISVLKTAVIFGPNASGKSNFIRAMEVARNIILNNQPLPYEDHRFKFDKTSLEKPTMFEFEIKGPVYNYAYGFSYTPDTIHREWLYKITKSTQELIFEKETKGGAYNIGNSFFKDLNNYTQQENIYLNKIAKNAPSNQLFLTYANAQKDIHEVLDVMDTYNWFKSLIVIHPQYIYRGFYMLPFENDFSKKFREFISYFDTGIDNIELKNIKKTDCDIEKAIITEAEKKLIQNSYIPFTTKKHNQYLLTKDEDSNFIIYEIRTHHTGASQDCWLKMSEESDGTKRLVDLLPILIDASMDKGNIFIIDELDRSLHPLLTQFFVHIFMDNSTNTQLIFTTHDKGLLDQSKFRKDEIWYIEKNSRGHSSLRSLAEYKDVRKDLDIEKGYISGRFGAIPMVNAVYEDKKRYSSKS